MSFLTRIFTRAPSKAEIDRLIAARKVAMDRFAKAGHGEREEALGALRRATDALMRAGG